MLRQRSVVARKKDVHLHSQLDHCESILGINFTSKISMKDVEAMAVVVNPTVKSQSPQRHVLEKLWDGDGRTYFAVEHAAHDKFIDFSSSCPRATKNISVRSGARGSVVQKAQSVELNTEVEHGWRKRERGPNS